MPRRPALTSPPQAFTIPSTMATDVRIAVMVVFSVGCFSACHCTNRASTSCGTSMDCPTGDTCVNGVCEAAGGDGGNGNGDSGYATLASLAFNPASATVLLDGGSPETASFVLVATLSNGVMQTVTADSLQFDRPDLATLTNASPATLTASGPFAGTGHLHAVYKGLGAQASLTVVMTAVDVGTGVTGANIGAFDGGSLSQDPALTSLLYPYDQTYFALGLTSPLLMWNAPNANDVYWVHLQQNDFTFDGYYVVAPPAQQPVPQDVWDEITSSNQGDPLHLVLSRLDANTGLAYQSATEAWTIIGASLRGTIYYWTTTGTGNMSRISPGTGAAPVILNGGICQGCHAVSADGTTLVAAVEGQTAIDNPSDSRAWTSYDLPADTVRIASDLFGGNVAVNYDGKYVVAGFDPLKLEDSTLGTAIPDAGLWSVPLEPGMVSLAHPAFAPDGQHFAAVQSNNNWYLWTLGTLVTMDFDELAPAFSNPRNLADFSAFDAGQQAVAYPSFSPDSQWLAFHVGDYASGCHDSCDATTTDLGALYIQNVSGTSPVRLDKLTDAVPLAEDRNHSFEPTFNPIERGGYFWLVFTSTRDWGNRITGTPTSGKKRLWVAAIDADGGTTDPSHPPFFLQGQEEDTMNMRGFWALSSCTPTPGADAGVDAGTCAAGFECCSGFCRNGVCVDVNQVQCAGLGEACAVNMDCCNPTVVTCNSGACIAAQ
jgi:hypothetical protein